MIDLVIDTDAGIDDAEAILMALRHPGTSVRAITTVTGNVGVEQVNRNVWTVMEAAGKMVPLYAGAAMPLIEPWHSAEFYHMNDGLGDWDERPPSQPNIQPEHAASALVRLANENIGELTLVAIGPLTNIALATRLDPTFPQKLKQFVFMGGAVNAVGNTHRIAAEFNIGADPEAAYIVLNSFQKSKMVGWETTLAHPIPWPDFDRLCAPKTPLASFYRGITSKITNKWRNMPGTKGHLLPDPLAMAITLEPSFILEQETRYMTVELGGHHARGQTIVNYTNQDHGALNVDIVRRINMDGIYGLYEHLLGV